MAKDPNQKDRPINGIGEAAFGSEEEFLGHEHQHMVSRISELVRPRGERYQRAIRERSQSLDALTNLRGNPNGQQLIPEMEATFARSEATISQYESRAMERGRTQYSTFLSRSFSPSSVNGQITRAMRTTEVQNLGVSMAMLPAQEIEERRRRDQEQLRLLHREAEQVNAKMWTKGGDFDPETSNQMRPILDRARAIEKQMASYDVAARHQRAIGTDPESVAGKSIAQYNQIMQRDRASAIASQREFEFGSGFATGQGSLGKVGVSDIMSGIAKEAQNLKEIFEQLADTTKLTTEQEAELHKQREASSKRLSDMETAAQGRGGRYGDIAGAAQLIGGGFTAAAGAVMAIGVNQRLAKEQNRAGFAALENEKYDTYRRARAGDIESQMMLGAFDNAMAFGGQLRTAANVSKTLEIGGNAAQGVAGVAKMQAAALSTPGGALTGNLGGAVAVGESGLMQTMSAAASFAVNTSDLAQGITAGQVDLAGQQARLNTYRQIIRNQATQVQGFRDYSVGAGAISMQMGRGGEAFMNEVVSDKNINRMAAARMSPEQFNQLSQIGVEQMGSTFGIDQVYTAQNLQRAGFGTAQQNMQRMSQLAQAGSNNPQAGLASVLEAAFSKSLDSSRALNMMAENTAAMVQSNAVATAAGIDVTSASAALLGANIDPNQKNEEFAVQRALSAAAIAREVTTNTEVSFAGMVNTSRTSRTTGLGGGAEIFATQLSTEELRGLAGKGDTDIRAALRKRGVNLDESKLSPQEFIKTQLENQMYSMVEGKGTGFALVSDTMRKSIVSKAMNKQDYSSLSAEEQTALGQIGSKFKLAGDEYYRSIVGIKETNTAGKAKAEEAMAGKGAGKLQEEAFNMATSGFTQMAEAAKQGAAAFGDAKKAFEALSEMSKLIESKGPEFEKKMSTAAGEAAGKFEGSSMEVFSSGASKILEAANILAGKAGIAPATAAAPKQRNMTKPGAVKERY